MKSVLLILCLITFYFSHSQKTLIASKQDYVSFVAVIDTALATKEGMYLNGYLVNINYAQAQKLQGKKVKVSGWVTIVKAYKKEDEPALRQGREKDIRHIELPRIELTAH